ncbi:MAG: transcription antitermination factor NusB [Gemmatimonadetes bacterium]|nr:transcription antitermination factor NusB [Gemmatimonadota bacterium]
MRARSRARGWALQILYAWEARGAQGSPLAILENFLEEGRIAESGRPHLVRILRAVAEHRQEIDGLVQQALTNWRLERLSAIDRNVLRLCAAEMGYLEDVPRRVALQEAIHLAEKYGTAESARFVNGVLDAVLHKLEGREPASLREGEGS